MTSLSNPVCRLRGFSLVEMMVSIAISMMVLMGVVAIFASSRATYETTERLSRIQENGRYALDQIVTDLRAAGYQGCARPNTMSSRAADFAITTLNNSNTLLWNFAVPIQGNQAGGGAWTPALDAAITSLAPAAVSDILILRVPRRDAVPVRLTATQANGTDSLTVDPSTAATLMQDDTAMISDCLGRAWFQVTSNSGGIIGHSGGSGPGNVSDDLRHPFARGAEIVPVTTIIYYVSPSGGDATRLSLYRKLGANLPEELAEGIERFELEYGVDSVGSDGRADAYVTAAAVTNWANVLSVRLALLARSPDPTGTDTDPETYQLLSNAPIGPFNDRHQRQVFTSTVAVRNQVID